MPLFDEEDLELLDEDLELLEEDLLPLEHFDPRPKPTSSLLEEDLEDFEVAVFFSALVVFAEAPVTVGAGTGEEEVEGEAVVVVSP